MAVRLRLQRHGRKQRPYYYVVAADARAPRDGRFIERLGSYDPTTQPATIELNVDASVKWLQVGAEPTDTVRAILSYRGAMYKNHLVTGVRKGAFDMEEAERRFQAWMDEKNAKISGHSDSIKAARQAERDKALDAERAVNEKRRQEVEAVAAAIAAEEAAKAAEIAQAEAAAAAAKAEAEAPAAEVEAPAAEAEASPAAETEASPAAEAEAPPAAEAEAPAQDENKETPEA
jgi:small subunit ribosomal protein S16